MIVQNMYNENSSNYNNSLRRHFNLNRHKFADAKTENLNMTTQHLSSFHRVTVSLLASAFTIYINIYISC